MTATETPVSPEGRHLIIRGRVQGVGYRWGMTQQAIRLGLRGWVRNRQDGCVEALIAGSAAAVAALLLWARSGPPGAEVEHIQVELSGPHELPQLVAFEQWPTL